MFTTSEQLRPLPKTVEGTGTGTLRTVHDQVKKVCPRCEAHFLEGDNECLRCGYNRKTLWQKLREALTWNR